MNNEIVIVDYGMANLRSVQKAFEAVGAQATISSDIALLAKADRLVLPGVGAFHDAIARVREMGLHDVIPRYLESGKPFLGICLGLQMLFTRSLEDGEHAGLNRSLSSPARIKSPTHGLERFGFPRKCLSPFQRDTGTVARLFRAWVLRRTC
jgi:imidazole glycerol phosphate synthase glutamine amidotransferase subunit